jgi:transmembrane sensor
LAASIAIAIVSLPVLRLAGLDVGFPRVRNTSQHITTQRGEQQSTVLPDGSRIELGGLTGVAVTYTPQKRLIVADEGEVLFKVAHDPSRPFVVQAGPVRVTAIGTAFSVRREGETVSVVVAEGVVEVTPNPAWEGRSEAVNSHDLFSEPVRAKAGQRVRISRQQPKPEVESVKSESPAAWHRGRLRFEDDPFSVVVASLNRYSPRQIVLTDPALVDLRFTGTIFDDRVDDWLQGVQVVFPVRVVQTDDQHVLIEPLTSKQLTTK